MFIKTHKKRGYQMNLVNKKNTIFILLVVLFYAFPSLYIVSASSQFPPQPEYIPAEISVVDSQNGTHSTIVTAPPYRVNWDLSVYGGLGNFRITGNFGDGGSFVWVNYPEGTYYPYHEYTGATGTYYQTWSQTNQGRTTYDYTQVTKQ
ncbi:MAG TPA: hypothetical protein PLU04_08055 [Anaerolineaceae bacterium]|nr:hypothetical protein [Anaerolineaceae bacterium]HQJ03634.1 hypothetical protein [Anaerolineaceae bacterium]